MATLKETGDIIVRAELKETDYIKAAKLVATCREDRLPMVLEILRQSGIDVSSLNEVEYTTPVKVAAERRRAERVPRKERWVKTDDPFIDKLRYAYCDGLNMRRLSESSGVGRTAIYNYMNGIRTPPEYVKVKVGRALDKMIAEIA